MLHDPHDWAVFGIIVIVLLAFDLFMHRKAHVIDVKEAVGWSFFWISLALLFNLFVYYEHGSQAGLEFLTAYLVEKSLSVDNLFVFLLLFSYFKTPQTALHKVLFWGVLGAIIFRGIFIWLGIALIANFHWIIYLFGGFLTFTGIKFAFEKDKQVEPEKNPVLKLFRRYFNVTESYDGDNFFTLKNGLYFATPLFVVTLAIETTDIVFAVDSVPAVLAITYDPFIAYTSNIFAILGLRSLYFALSHIMGLFHYLHYGLAFILVFIGTKMMLSDIYKIENTTSLAVITITLILSVAASILLPAQKK